ncbi:MAG: flagellar biosynthesis anti-sigma factor FlgM [Acidobacteria bacterium]|nr:flagellar biosynthesis anti-sigma factor FlgM [Acidobacteriota bacterium]
MKINNGYNANAAQAAERAQEAAAAQSKSGKVGAKQQGSDEVSLSSLASAVQSALSDSPDRLARVERLAAEFAAGNYQPDAQATANGLISDALSSNEDGKR